MLPFRYPFRKIEGWKFIQFDKFWNDDDKYTGEIYDVFNDKIRLIHFIYLRLNI